MCSWCLQLTGNIDAADDVGAEVSSVLDDSILVVVSSIDLEISDLSNDTMNYFIIDISVNAYRNFNAVNVLNKLHFSQAERLYVRESTYVLQCTVCLRKNYSLI